MGSGVGSSGSMCADGVGVVMDIRDELYMLLSNERFNLTEVEAKYEAPELTDVQDTVRRFGEVQTIRMRLTFERVR